MSGIRLSLLSFLTQTQKPARNPPWGELEVVGMLEEIEQLRESKLLHLRNECRERVTEAYGETTFQGEMMLRLRNGQTEAMDTERDRLREKYRSIRDTINVSDKSALESLDVTSDDEWS